MNKIRVGVVGVGHIGREHARVYSQMPEVEFVGLYGISAFTVALGLGHLVGFVALTFVCFSIGMLLCLHGLVPEEGEMTKLE